MVSKFLASVAGAAVVAFVLLEVVWLSSHGISAVNAPAAQLSVSSTTVATSTDVYTIHLVYPTFNIKEADRRVRVIVDDALADFTSYPPNPTPVSAPNELDGEFDRVYLGKDFISARMQIYEFTGGAHGGTVAYGLNFHPDGSQVSLDEALALIGKNLEQVSSEAMRQLNDRFEMVQFPEGATPETKNYGTFIINKDSVTFIFQQYQVEAYAAGMPEVTFARVQ